MLPRAGSPLLPALLRRRRFSQLSQRTGKKQEEGPPTEVATWWGYVLDTVRDKATADGHTDERETAHLALLEKIKTKSDSLLGKNLDNEDSSDMDKASGQEGADLLSNGEDRMVDLGDGRDFNKKN